MFRKPEGGKVVEMGCLAAHMNNADEVKMDVQKVYDARDTYGPLSNANPTISEVATKPLSSNMESRYVLTTKTPSFE